MFCLLQCKEVNSITKFNDSTCYSSFLPHHYMQQVIFNNNNNNNDDFNDNT